MLHLEAELTGRVNPAALATVGPEVSDFEGRPCRKVVSFLFKFSRSPGGRRFDFVPRLVREALLFRPRDDLMSGNGTLELVSSPHDPLGDIPVRDLMDVTYGTWDNDMLPGRVVARVRNPLAFARYAMFKEDFAGWFLDSGEASLPPKGRERSRRRKMMKAF